MMKQCYICGRWAMTERHHVFNGALRRKSEKYGCVVDLCHWCHNEPPYGVHFNQELDNRLKATYQRKVMAENGWDRQKFIQEFGRSYINE